MSAQSRYEQIIEIIFLNNYRPGDSQITFVRSDLESAANLLGIKLPKNLGDLIYSFKFRNQLPESIVSTAPEGKEWLIKNIGRSRYCFQLVNQAKIKPDLMLITIKIPDSTPGIVLQHTSDDEQALLARLRYNKLVDIFTGVVCFSLQSHLRTTVPNVGQIETDEIYVGVNKHGQQFILPIQAKGSKDEIGVSQIEQDILLCQYKYPNLICRPMAAKFLSTNKICMIEFSLYENNICKVSEKHYQLVKSDEISSDDLVLYNNLASPQE